MSTARARKVLLAALAISVIVHLLLAGYIRWPAILRPNEEMRIAKVRVITVARRTPPPPPPTPVPTPAATPRVRASIAPPRTVAHTPKGTFVPPKTIGPGVSAHTPIPSTPIPTSSPGSCIHNTSDPAVSATPDVGEISADVRAAKVSGTAAIRVELNPEGRVLDAAVAQSTGNSGLDGVAMQMARNATYTPKYVDCKPVAGAYVFKVNFVAW